MASRPVKLKLAPRATLKAKALTRFPARVLGTGGVNITQSGATYTFSLDLGTVPDFSLGSPFTVGDIFYAFSTTHMASIHDVATGNVLLSGGTGIAPSYGKVTLTGHVSGILPAANGGTGIANTGTITVTGNTSLDLAGTFTTGGAITLGALVQGDIWYASATGVMSVLNKNTTATRYLSNTGTSNNPAWAQVDLSNGVTGRTPYANVTQATARSVLGVTGNATADVASIQGTANQVLVVNSAGTALAFGQVNLASASAVTGDLPFSAVAQISGYSLVGNTTASTADIAGFTVGGLTQKATPAGTDLVLIQDQAASGQLKYATVSAVGASAGVSSIAGNTGAFTLSHGITNSTNDIRIGQLYMHANLSADQSVVTTTKTKCNFNTEVYDPQGWYDNATNFRFTPLVAGKYLVTVNIFFSGTTVSNFVLTMIYKNGSELAESLNASTSSGGAATATAIVDMNGSSDFIEGWGRLTASASPVFSGGTAPVTSWMSIAYIGS